MLEFLRRLFKPKPKACTWDDFYRIQREVYAEQAREDALLTEYLALKDRPTVTMMMATIEGAEARPVQMIDTDDYWRWRKERNERAP